MNLSEKTWHDNYKCDGETTIEDSRRRWARAGASVESEDIRHEIEKDFLYLFEDGRAYGGGRIMANLGVAGRDSTTLYNCFVLDAFDACKTKKGIDSLEGIYEQLSYQSLTLKSEGGYGHNFSYIRPEGCFVKGIGSRTPGVLHFMRLWNESSDIITLGSQKVIGGRQKQEKNKIRKGAMMGVLNIWHPQIVEFIQAKQVAGAFSKFNLSVGITEGFEEARDNDLDWDLVFPDTTHPNYNTEWNGDLQVWKDKEYPVIVYETMKARDLWEIITKSTYNRNEPGVLNLAMANRLNPLSYAERLHASNPCLTGDTLVAVADGFGDRTIKELADAGKDIPVYCEDYAGKLSIRTMRNPRITGTKKVYEITLENGHKIKATGNHKFKTTENEYKQVDDLKVGDGLLTMSKQFLSIKDVFPNANSNSQDYVWMSYRNSPLYSEHRMIYEFDTDSKIPKGSVIHHVDFNSKNNHISNLRMMTKEDHDRLHADLMFGENNPMNRWYKNATESERQRYHDNMSKATSGIRNGNSSGITNDELYQHATNLTKQLNRLFTTTDWKKYAEENNLPKSFSSWRKNHLGGISGLAKKVANELGLLPCIDASPKVLQVYFSAIEQGYDAEVIENEVFVNKVCETCGKQFKAPYQRREYGMCSSECGFKSYTNNRQSSVKEQQMAIFNRIKFEKNAEPLKSEWVSVCKSEGVSSEISRTSSPFKSYDELKEASLTFNHRIIAIEECGIEDVYNGTVDDFHNFFVGGFSETSSAGKPMSVYINNRQCGEILMSTGVCNLLSLNLVKYLKYVNGKLEFDFEMFAKCVQIGVRFSDNINDISVLPLPEYAKSVKDKRRIGMGVLGLGSLHIMLGIKYGSKESLELTEMIFKTKAENELIASSLLGAEKGNFELFDKDKYFNTIWWNTLEIDPVIKSEIESRGTMRNSHRSANAPTGNMGIVAGLVSGGIEPVFSLGYSRWVSVPEHEKTRLESEGLVIPRKDNLTENDIFKFGLAGDEQVLFGSFQSKNYQIDQSRGLTIQDDVNDYGWNFVNENYSPEEIKALEESGKLATAQAGLDVIDHLEVLRVVAKYTDMNSSKTINLPNDYPYEKFLNVYTYCSKHGIKGATTYRDGTMTAVMFVEPKVGDKELNAQAQKHAKESFINAGDGIVQEDVKLPYECPSMSYVLKDSNKKKWYVHINFVDDTLTKPFAIFVNTNSREDSEVAEHTITDLISVARESGIRDDLIEDQIEKFKNQSNIKKIARAIGFLLRHNVPIIEIVAVIDKGNYPLSSFTFHIKRLLKQFIPDGVKATGKKCDQCGSENVVMSEGCYVCMDCASSKCS